MSDTVSTRNQIADTTDGAIANQIPHPIEAAIEGAQNAGRGGKAITAFSIITIVLSTSGAIVLSVLTFGVGALALSPVMIALISTSGGVTGLSIIPLGFGISVLKNANDTRRELVNNENKDVFGHEVSAALESSNEKNNNDASGSAAPISPIDLSSLERRFDAVEARLKVSDLAEQIQLQKLFREVGHTIEFTKELADKLANNPNLAWAYFEGKDRNPDGSPEPNPRILCQHVQKSTFFPALWKKANEKRTDFQKFSELKICRKSNNALVSLPELFISNPDSELFEVIGSDLITSGVIFFSGALKDLPARDRRKSTAFDLTIRKKNRRTDAMWVLGNIQQIQKDQTPDDAITFMKDEVNNNTIASILMCEEEVIATITQVLNSRFSMPTEGVTLADNWNKFIPVVETYALFAMRNLPKDIASRVFSLLPETVQKSEADNSLDRAELTKIKPREILKNKLITRLQGMDLNKLMPPQGVVEGSDRDLNRHLRVWVQKAKEAQKAKATAS
ncbi:MAG: hypothetical protein LBB14_00265 [Puniceicoccales bacterium]|jgi:hypothetical protein|nr:hypothetical protein [Puniceicoccales bacterium]